jgi:hypothetical protein
VPVVRPGEAILFRRGQPGSSPPRGILVQILQGALTRNGHFFGVANGIFDETTETALRSAQRAAGRTADGICRDADWDRETGLPLPSLFDRCLQLSSAIEGTGFEKVSGNHDGAGLTWGVAGHRLRDDLPAFLGRVDAEYPGTLIQCFAENYGELLRVLKLPTDERVRWADGISTGPTKLGVRDDWRAGFAMLGSRPDVQDLQANDALARLWAPAVQRARRMGATDALDVAIVFDTIFQHGGETAAVAGALDAAQSSATGLSSDVRRRHWAEAIAAAGPQAAQTELLRRRTTIATGRGLVRNETYDLADWGITAVPVDLAALGREFVTFMPIAFAPATPQLADVSAAPGTVARPPITPPLPAGPTKPTELAADYKAAIARALPLILREGLDRNWGPPAPEPVDALLATKAADLPGDWQGWPEGRKAVALLQLVAKAKAIDPGPVDGFWGQVTQDAFDELVYWRDNGKARPKFRDTEPIDVNPNNWPRQSGMTSFYGPACKVPQVRVRCPWTLRLAWDLNSEVAAISIHEKCAPSLERILKRIHEHYGDAELRRLRLDRFGGSYNCRQMRGSSAMSTHAWAIAIDWDPDNNQLSWGRDRATLAKPEYGKFWEIWEQEGWLSLGRVRNYDWMHVQAAKL